MSKSSDKLAKLANFGNSAGSKPAAAAVAKSLNTDPATLPEATLPEASLPSKRVDPGTSQKESKKTEATASKMRRASFIRNISFTPEDQMHLDRISELLVEAGEFRPSIADLVRVALRGSAKLDSSSALRMLDETRKFDGRRNSPK